MNLTGPIWCNMDSDIIRRLPPERRKILSAAGNRAQEIARQSREPRIYCPMSQDMQYFAIVGCTIFEEPRIVTRLWFDRGHNGWYRTVTDGSKDTGSMGLRNGLEDISSFFPPVLRY